MDDINVKVIEGVRQYPSLHNNNSNLDERNQAWVHLSEKLKVPELFLKIRWHTLRQEYQRDMNFKYAENMSFVCVNNDLKAKVENWPEFIITEEDIKDNNPEEQEQFVLLEEDSKSLKENVSGEKECALSESVEGSQDIPNKSFKTNEGGMETKICEGEEKSCSKSYARLSKDDIAMDNSNNVGTIKTSNIEESIPVFPDNNKNLTEVSFEKLQPVIKERCEDVIFGELVSAMLKRMDESKKKNIKKEIMNLLFS